MRSRKTPLLPLGLALTFLIPAGCSDDDGGPAPSAYERPEWADYVYTPSTGLSQEQIDRFVELNQLDTTVSPSGLVYQVLEVGSGDSVRVGDRPVFFYRAYRVDGVLVDNPNAAVSEEPEDIPLDVLSEGVRLLRVGGRGVFVARPALAYGNAGFPSRGVESTTVLVYELAVVDLLDPE